MLSAVSSVTFRHNTLPMHKFARLTVIPREGEHVCLDGDTFVVRKILHRISSYNYNVPDDPMVEVFLSDMN